MSVPGQQTGNAAVAKEEARFVSKTVRIVVVGALLLLLTAGAAVAQDVVGKVIRCDGGRCEGTDDRDTIVASDRSEEVFAKAGDDDIELDATIAIGSDDVAYGDLGRDCIDGGAGDDLMIGGPGDDNRPCEFTAFVNPRAALTSGPGDDTIEGGPGDDSMDGIADDDTLIGGEGNDLIEDFQQLDSDTLLGGEGNDTLNATDGDRDDLVDGGPGRDECSGDAGDTFRNCEIGVSQAEDNASTPSQDGAGAGPASEPGAGAGPASEPRSFTELFGSARTTTALRNGLVTVPGMAVHCGVGPCKVYERLFSAKPKRTRASSHASGKRPGLLGRDRDVVVAGTTHQVRLRLSKSAIRTLRRRGRMGVEVLVTVTDAKGRSQLARKLITVKRAS